jgi:hypothetical protein
MARRIGTGSGQEGTVKSRKGKIKRGTPKKRYNDLVRALRAGGLDFPTLRTLTMMRNDLGDLSSKRKWLGDFKNVYRKSVKNAKVRVSVKPGKRVNP